MFFSRISTIYIYLRLPTVLVDKFVVIAADVENVGWNLDETANLHIQAATWNSTYSICRSVTSFDVQCLSTGNHGECDQMQRENGRES